MGYWIGIGFFVFGGVYVYSGARLAMVGYESTGWNTAQATVLDLNFLTASGSTGQSNTRVDLAARVEYAFVANGVTYTGSSFHPVLEEWIKPSEKSQYESQFAPGNVVEIRFDPTDPNRSAVRSGRLVDGGRSLLIGIGVCLCGLLVMTLVRLNLVGSGDE